MLEIINPINYGVLNKEFSMRFTLIGRSRSGTTISQKIINKHPDIWLTNELWIYEYAVNARPSFCDCSTAEKYFKAIENNIIPGREVMPGFNKKGFAETCNALCQLDTLSNRVSIAEKVLFNDYNFMLHGDKAELPFVPLELIKNNIPIKIIHIHRDGRDVVSSGLRHFKITNADIEWHRSTPFDNSVYWAKGIREWQRVRESLTPEMFLELRFEDYFEFPGRNAEKIANFLKVSKSLLIDAEKSFVDPSKSNVGYFKKWAPNWKSTFSEDAIEILKELHYIGA